MALDLSLNSDSQNFFDTTDMQKSGNPFDSNASNPFSASSEPSRAVNSLEQMRTLAKQQGYDPEQGTGIFSKVGSGLKSIGSAALDVLTFIPSTLAGITASTEDIASGDFGHAFDTIRKFQKERDGFADAIKYYYKPTSFAGKAVVFGAGLGLDILSDPLTYLTGGFSAAEKGYVGLKALEETAPHLVQAAEKAGIATGAEKVLANASHLIQEEGRVFNPVTKAMEVKMVPTEVRLTSRGSALMEEVRREGNIISLADQLAVEGVDRIYAEKLAKDFAQNDIKLIIDEVAAKDGGQISQKTFDRLIEKGFSRATLEDINQLGPQLIERYGINWFGQRLIDSATLKNTVIGKAATALYQNYGFETVVNAIAHPMKKLFVYGYMQNPKLLAIFEKMGFAKQAQTTNELRNLEEILRPLSSEQENVIAHSALQKRMDIVKEIKARTAGIEGINEAEIAAQVKAEFAKNPLKFNDPIVQEISDKLFGDNGLMKRLASTINVDETQMYDTYLPFLFEDGLKVGAFGNGKWASAKRLGKQAGEWTMDTYKDAGGVTNLSKLLAVNASDIIDSRIKSSFMQTAVNSLGKSLDHFGANEAEAMFNASKAGYEKFMIKLPYGEKEIGGYFPKELIPELKKGYGTKDLGVLSVLGIKHTFDWMTAMHKAWVTGLFPNFHFKNWASNNMNSLIGMGLKTGDLHLQNIANHMALSDLKNYETFGKFMGKSNEIVQGWGVGSKQWLQKQTLTNDFGETMNAWKFFKEVRRKAPNLFQAGQFGMSELGIHPGGVAPLLDRMPKAASFLLDPKSSLWQVSRDVGSHIEGQGKLVNIIGTWMNGGTIEDGIKMAEKNLFNYNKLSDFEKTVMKRIIPFYTFARKNAEFQMRMLAEKPGTTFAQFKILNNLTASFSNAHETDGKSGLPAYAQDSMGFHIGNSKDPNSHKYISGFGLPLEQFLQNFSGPDGLMANTMKSVFGQANPLVKAPIEYLTGNDLFTGKRIDEINNPGVFGSMIDGMPTKVADQFKKLIDYRVIEKPVVVNGQVVGHREVRTMDPVMLWILRNSPFSKVASTLNQTSEANMQKVGGGDEALRFITGVNIQPIDDKRNIFFTRMQEYKDLGNWLEKVGVINSYQSYSLPQTVSKPVKSFGK